MQIRLLREILEWGEGMELSMEAPKAAARRQAVIARVVRSGPNTGGGGGEERIIVLVFPEGDFKVVPKGTTAANIIQEQVCLGPHSQFG